MFNRKDLPSMPNPFGPRQDGRPPQPGYANPNQAPPRYDNGHSFMAGAGNAVSSLDYDVPMTDAPAGLRGYGAPPPPMGRPPQQTPARMPVGGRPMGGGRTWTLSPVKSPDPWGNLYVRFVFCGTELTSLMQRCCFFPRFSTSARRF